MINNEIEKPFFGVATKSLEPGSLSLLESYGVELPWEDPDFDRMCTVELPAEEFDLVRFRPKDMPARVAAGDVVLGVSCTDGLVESGYKPDQVEVVRKLGFGACMMSLLVPNGSSAQSVSELEGSVIATSYPKATEAFFANQKVELGDIVLLDGSVEGMVEMPKTRVDAVVDLVQSGSSMRANRLRKLANIRRTEAALISNPELSSKYSDVFDRFYFPLPAAQSVESYPVDTPERVRALDSKLASPREGSGSFKMLEKGVEAINLKLGEETNETLQAFFAEEDEALLDEAQTVIWVVALGLRARGLQLGPSVAGANFEPLVEQKGNQQNDAIRSYGAAKGAFSNALLRGDKKRLAESASLLLGSIDNLVSLRNLNMAQVYERL